MLINEEIIQKAKELAYEWQKNISQSREAEEIRFHEMMIHMLENPKNKLFLIELLDQSFRSHDTQRVADQLEFLFEKYNDTSFFNLFEEMLIWLFRHIGIYTTKISIPLFIQYLRDDISAIVIKGEEKYLIEHIKRRKEEGTRVNINIIGEAVLGEEEAKARVKKYIKALQNPDIDYISIKISTIFSQIIPLAHEWSVKNISQRIASIYDAAIENKYIDKNGKEQDKFVNLDMEEYKDLSLTVDAFIKTLSQEKYQALHAGIVIQTYMPDALLHVKRLVAWASMRVKSGGAPIKIRVVKGANQEMEMTEASLRGWNSITYSKKSQSDANFKVVLEYLLRDNVSPYVHVGVASHNLFDQAFAYELAKKRGVVQYYSAEMLEGMSESAYRALKKENINVILYAPTATKETFTNAIAYLVRRFDENTAEANFLRHSFGLSVEDKAWNELIKTFDRSIEEMQTIPLTPFRVQDRRAETIDAIQNVAEYEFKNESDTDFALEANREWAEQIISKWKNIGANGGYHAHSVIAGKEVVTDVRVNVIDKSQYHEKVDVGSYTKVSKNELALALQTAQDDIDGWRRKSSLERTEILMNVANEFRRSRADLVGIAAAEVGKVFSETDVEVSEAIDFLNFYPYSYKKLESLGGISLKAKGVGLVVSPWNFPIAIPTGGVAAALSAGNCVILKAASNSALSAHRLCQCFWDGGVSKNTLQYVITDGELTSSELIAKEAVDFVIFTGSEETAYSMIKTRPSLHISAETGGKDATIVTALSDRDQAIKNVIASAFNNSGQKCSATSLLVLEEELYSDKEFQNTLIDAVNSVEVGSVWELHNKVGTLSSLAGGKLAKALEYLDEGEEWLIEPSYADENPYMLKPSIRWGTQKGDYCHMNELFGPVLSVIRAKDLEDAIDIVNATGYGLTSGLESLDEREKAIYKENMRAGNLYLNRVTTGAIVRRQPFGGMGKSSIGSGRKAGGFNYIAQFVDISTGNDAIEDQNTHPLIEEYKTALNITNIDRIFEIFANFSYWVDKEFSKEHDHSNVRGESNHIRYLSVKSVLLRIDKTTTLEELLCSVFAVHLVGAKLHLSCSHEINEETIKNVLDTVSTLEKDIVISFEDEEQLMDSIKEVERVRFLTHEVINEGIYKALSDDAIYISSEPFVAHGRVEMLHYYIEQSVSDSYHRYGNLGEHGLNDKGGK